MKLWYWLGSPVAETNTSGNLVGSFMHYQAFGETIEAPKDEVGYTGHKFDTDLGLSYMQARYYDPVIGRFYSNDPVGAASFLQEGNIHGFNRYAYANNNPYKFVDLDGRAPTRLGQRLDQRVKELENGTIDKEQFSAEIKAEAKGGIEGLKLISGPAGKVIDAVTIVASVIEGEAPISDTASAVGSDTAGKTVDGIADGVKPNSSGNKYVKAGKFLVEQVIGNGLGELSKSTEDLANEKLSELKDEK